jgi:hypothetical protein
MGKPVTGCLFWLWRAHLERKQTKSGLTTVRVFWVQPAFPEPRGGSHRRLSKDGRLGGGNVVVLKCQLISSNRKETSS